MFLEENTNLLQEIHDSGHDLVLAVGRTEVDHFTLDLLVGDFLYDSFGKVTLWVEGLTHPVLPSVVTTDDIQRRLAVANWTLVAEVAPSLVLLVVEEGFLLDVTLKGVSDGHYFSRVVLFGDGLLDRRGHDHGVVLANDHIKVLASFNT